MTQQQTELMDIAIKALFQTSDYITSLDVKEYLRLNYPNILWNQAEVGKYLRESSLERINHNDTYNIYENPVLSDVQTISVNLNPIIDAIFANVSSAGIPTTPVTKENILEKVQVNTTCTKKELKKYFKEQGYDLTNFKQAFDECGFKSTGKYTAEHHKIYVRLTRNSHFSQSGQKVMDVTKMAKPHLLNTIRKYYGNMKMSDIEDDGSEISQLLTAYFTWNFRNNL